MLSQIESVRFLKASLGRRYRDRNGNWKTSQSFSRHEIPLAIYCLMGAFEAMIRRENEENPMGAVEEERVE